MSTTKLKSFPDELKGAWKLFQGQWTTAILLSLIPVIPFLLTIPYLLKYAYALQASPAPYIPIESTSILALIGLIGLVITAQISKAGLYILFSRGKGLTAKKAFKEGFQQFIPFVYTNILVLLTVVVLLIPALALHTWYGNSMRVSIDVGINGIIAIDLFVLAVVTILALPAIYFAISFTFAPIMVATKTAKGGAPALKESYTLVSKKIFPVLFRLIGWGILYVILTRITSTLLIANWLVPFLMMIIGAAFLVIMYKELKSNQ